MLKDRKGWQFAAAALGVVVSGLIIWIAKSELKLARAIIQIGIEEEGQEVGGEWVSGGVISGDQILFLRVFGPVAVEWANQGNLHEVEWRGTTQFRNETFDLLRVTESPPKLIDARRESWVHLPPEIVELARTPEKFRRHWREIQKWCEGPEVPWQDLPPRPEK